jgi:hypothetical protein
VHKYIAGIIDTHGDPLDVSPPLLVAIAGRRELNDGAVVKPGLLSWFGDV